MDLFSGIGGLSTGLKRAGFDVVAAVELDQDAVAGYKLNYPRTKVFAEDIRDVDLKEIRARLKGRKLQLLAGCPPCQGFSSLRRLNKKQNVRDPRNSLVLEFLRYVKELKPETIMMENVPGLINYYHFKSMVRELKKLGYNPKAEVVNVKDYGVPQRRRRLVLVGSKLGPIDVSKPIKPKATVRSAIGKLESVSSTEDQVHKIVAGHTQRIQEMIEMIPEDGGGRNDLPKDYLLECHKKENVGFDDIYGRLRWDDWSTTITGGCLNPSKGRFLHPSENRCITAREAALLQTFPLRYKFPVDMNKGKLALLIGNALPPKFSFIQSQNIREHIETYRKKPRSKLRAK